MVVHTVHTFTVQSVMRFVFYSRQAVSTGPALTVLCGRKTARGLRGNQRSGRHQREVPVETGHRKRYIIRVSKRLLFAFPLVNVKNGIKLFLPLPQEYQRVIPPALQTFIPVLMAYVMQLRARTCRYVHRTALVRNKLKFMNMCLLI